MFRACIRLGFAIVVVLGGAAIGAIATHAYSTYAKWALSPVLIFVNPQNADVGPAEASSAVQAGMDAWNSSGANIQFQYAGRVGDTTVQYDARNVVLFRNESNGSALATTYSWYSGSTLLDADIVVWDGAVRLFTGSSGCASGAYVEDIATHELGHALGLNHSTSADATMYPYYSFCSQEMRTLSSDDIAGVRSLYGGAKVTNTAPTVSVVSPLNGADYGPNPSVWFSGSAADAQDGDLTPGMTWMSSLDGYLGSGGSFSRTLSAGSHVITASITDTGGLSASKQISVTVASATPQGSGTSTPDLTVNAIRSRKLRKANLWWAGFNSLLVDVYRNGVLIVTTSNDGFYTDPINQKGSASYTYQLCAGDPRVCTNEVTVAF